MSESIDTNAAVALIEAGGIIYLLLHKEDGKFTIQGWKTPKEAKGYFEGGYDRMHNRSYESSMSACINFIQFQPRIVTFPTVEQLAETLGIVEGQTTAVHLSSVSGWMDVLELDQEKARPVWESGETPALISEDTFEAPVV